MSRLQAEVPALVPWILGALLLWLGLRWFERASLYIPSRTHYAHPGTYGFKFEDLTLAASDGATLHAWYIEREPSDPVILFCHGNAGNISHRMEKARLLRSAGASLLLFDYRGYGRSSGSPTEQGTYLDAEAARRWLTEAKGVPGRRLVYHGESLGCAVALELALRHPPAGVILESPFTSVADMGREVFPFLPVRWMISFRYDNLAKIGRLAAPLLVMHSPADDIIPYRMGRRLFDAAPEPKLFADMRGDHNEGFLDMGTDYPRAVAGFLRSLKEERPPIR